MATAQPISFPHPDSQDFPMGSGSFTGQNGSFNASSLTRHLIGSPLSFRSGSYGSRFYPGMSPGQLLGPLDPNEYRFGKMSSSIESDRGSIVNALATIERQDELCRDYTCCGLNLTDLHALVDHFEECHVVVVDPYAPPQSLPPTSVASLPSSVPQSVASYFPDSCGVPSTSNQRSARAQSQHQSVPYQGFDPADDMELDLDQNTSAPSSGAPSPPDTPISTPLSGYPSPTYSAAPSPHPSQPASPISAFETTTVLPSRAHHGGFRSSVGAGPSGSATRTEDAFNAYAGYSDYSSLLPGAAPLGSGPNTMFLPQQGLNLGHLNGQAVCAPTALLLSSSGSNTPDSTPASSRVASPIPGGSGSGFRTVAPNNTQASSSNAGASSSSGAGSSSSSNVGASSSTARASTTLSRPASSLLLSKPFKCPKANCNKSYKQANGLKYHMTHGSCNFAPPKDLEHLQELLASKRSEKARAAAAGRAGENGGMGVEGEGEVTLSEAEMREVEKEAERRLRPYACGVGECQRRYKNMNGLRYHYQHSGDHGAIGLALLASGQHECLQHNKSSRHSTPSHSASNSLSSPGPAISRGGSQATTSTAGYNLSHSRSHQTAQGQNHLQTQTQMQTHIQTQTQNQPQNQSQSQPFAQPPSYQSALANPPSYTYQHPHPHQPGQYAHHQYAAQQQQGHYVLGMQQ